MKNRAAVPTALSPAKGPSTHRTGGWRSQRFGFGVATRYSCTCWELNPGPPSLYWLACPDPILLQKDGYKFTVAHFKVLPWHSPEESSDWILGFVKMFSYLKMTFFWDMSLLEVHRRFRGHYCLRETIAVMMEAVSTSEMSLNVWDQTAQCTRRLSFLCSPQSEIDILFITSWNTRRCSGFKIKWNNSSDMFVAGFWIVAAQNLVGIS
jgi:hypothetical protein